MEGTLGRASTESGSLSEHSCPRMHSSPQSPPKFIKSQSYIVLRTVGQWHFPHFQWGSITRLTGGTCSTTTGLLRPEPLQPAHSEVLHQRAHIGPRICPHMRLCSNTQDFSPELVVGHMSYIFR
ncbi:UNVERIFIED_CONTAM: hypothetical protein Sradi_3006700 [Sesamum radiatum]|uniref:Uncharacterized protein n=1 Tax=Sesamum radiatum TaxID=300843 RepID=A0AAW2S138_SESRA